jgi:hypothetical protein
MCGSGLQQALVRRRQAVFPEIDRRGQRTAGRTTPLQLLQRLFDLGRRRRHITDVGQIRAPTGTELRHFRHGRETSQNEIDTTETASAVAVFR